MDKQKRAVILLNYTASALLIGAVLMMVAGALAVNAPTYVPIARMDLSLAEASLKHATINALVGYVNKKYADVNVALSQNLNVLDRRFVPLSSYAIQSYTPTSTASYWSEASLSALLPVAAELMEGGASVGDVVSSIIAYIEARGGKALPTNAPADAKRALVAWLHGGGAGTGQRPDVELEVEDAVLDAYVERCFSLPLNVLPTRQGNVRVLPRERNGVWRLGDPIDGLDVLETLRTYGTMVPGHTTIKAFERPVA